MEDLQLVEHVCRKDPKVIEQCVISGIPREDMDKVYCDRECTTYMGDGGRCMLINGNGSMDNRLRRAFR